MMSLFRFVSLVFTLFIFLVITFPTYAAGEPPATFQSLEGIFEGTIRWVAIIGGFLAFLAVILGGFKYITARGDPKAVAGAQATVTWAFIGLALIIVAWLILVFISDFTGVDVTIFKIETL